MGIEWAGSSDKHGIPRGDALYAIQHFVFWSDEVDVATGKTQLPRKLFIGPAHAQTERLLEVLVELRPGAVFWVYHVMDLGAKYRRLMEEEQ